MTSTMVPKSKKKTIPPKFWNYFQIMSKFWNIETGFCFLLESFEGWLDFQQHDKSGHSCKSYRTAEQIISIPCT